MNHPVTFLINCEALLCKHSSPWYINILICRHLHKTTGKIREPNVIDEKLAREVFTHSQRFFPTNRSAADSTHAEGSGARIELVKWVVVGNELAGVWGSWGSEGRWEKGRQKQKGWVGGMCLEGGREKERGRELGLLASWAQCCAWFGPPCWRKCPLRSA